MREDNIWMIKARRLFQEIQYIYGPANIVLIFSIYVKIAINAATMPVNIQ